ncbi:hypothetical protein UFOVP75_84 [uncultured Caudovirales phage]|uniref:Uncharacterized protein n=1 Tax=uncultured Caudovirales phage TaxID=2100421 RepID=A0A6J5KXI2_9CAUD|nr:hypothetical protein UFOVP75_84 [uncultured Caudovirales phage]
MTIRDRLDKEDRVWEYNAGGFGDPTVEIMRMNGQTGAVTFSNAVKVTLPTGSAISLAPGDVSTAELADKAVTKAKAAVFFSTLVTATGSSQNVAHGLGVIPAAVLVVPEVGCDGAGATGTQMPAIAEGSHDATNVKVTVTAGAKVKILAWA